MRPIASPSAGLRSHHGFTLIELIVAIAVLAIMVTWAVPSFQQFTARNEVAAEVMRLKSALAMTRSAAITRRGTVTLCPSVDMSQCAISNNADGKAWLATLAIFEGRGEPGDTLLRTLGESRLPAITYRNDNRPVRYKALGRTMGYNGTFRLCGGQEEGASVIVSNAGRVRVESSRPSEC
ncbi:GspH/FimT family pseudopilin [Halomonas icarae]|uniref:Type II secretion system protein H n=1 Tax=Halomonas icarae TaxID=2691040 RepID=A0A7X4VZH7_9GAMM|nr:GspH/FimT family pseudopilin [Halomonas icarae]MDR5903628.1 GspH/FimT family pseudopilin [Halomonas icarae]NAW13194.1 prepilin-type N-terminal cleavage/methylation domain-containing protein [Halomonas icarae]